MVTGLEGGVEGNKGEEGSATSSYVTFDAWKIGGKTGEDAWTMLGYDCVAGAGGKPKDNLKLS